MSKSNPNFLHLIDTTGPGGAESVFSLLAQSTKNAGYETIALIRGPGWVENELKKHGIKTIVKDCKGSFNLSFLIFLVKLIRKHKIDIVQSHLLGSNVYASLAGWLCGVRVFSTFHGHVDISPKERFLYLKLLLVRLGSEKVIAVTEKIKNVLSNVKNGVLSIKLCVIANGINLNEFLNETDNITIRRDNIKIGCLGNVRKAKNYPLAVEFIQNLQSSGINASLWIAGDHSNDLGKELKRKIENSHTEKNIHLLGFIDNVSDFLSSIDIFLMTSSSEGHPLALIQAMASSKPVITTPSGIEEIIPSNTAFISKGHNVKALMEVFEDYMRSSSIEIRQRVIKAREEVINFYSSEAMINSYHKNYRI